MIPTTSISATSDRRFRASPARRSKYCAVQTDCTNSSGFIFSANTVSVTKQYLINTAGLRSVEAPQLSSLPVRCRRRRAELGRNVIRIVPPVAQVTRHRNALTSWLTPVRDDHIFTRPPASDAVVDNWSKSCSDVRTTVSHRVHRHEPESAIGKPLNDLVAHDRWD
jgi:hypothetical protein